jgi:hypothetical protein
VPKPLVKIWTNCEVADAMCAGNPKKLVRIGTWTIPPPMPSKLDTNPMPKLATMASARLNRYW